MRKHILAIGASALVLSVTQTVTAQHSNHEDHTAQEQEKVQKYTCMMHPEVIADHPGNCPKCGMKLVPVEQHKRRTSNVEHATPNAQATETRQSHMSHVSHAAGEHEHEKMEMS